MNSQLTKANIEKKYPPLEMPQILLNLIERRIHGLGEYFSNPISILVVFVVFVVAVIVEILIFKTLRGLCLIVAVPLIFFWHFFDENASAAHESVKQIRSRVSPNEQEFDILWECKNKAEIARKINSICIEQIAWDEDVVFLPNDPFCLMIELYTGDLCEVEAIMAIEEEFSLKFPYETFEEESPGDLKFKDVVNYILENKLEGALPASDK